MTKRGANKRGISTKSNLEANISLQKKRNHKIAFLLVTSAYAALSLSTNAIAQNAQQVQNSANQKAFNIAPQTLSSALIEYGNQSGLQVSVNNSLVSGVQTRGISGNYAPYEALSHILAGTGLTWKVIDNKTIGIEPAPQTSDETITLGPVRVAGTNVGGNGGNNGGTTISNTNNGRVAGWDGTAQSVYKTAGSVSVVTREQLESYPATAPADMLKSQSGVISGEARTSGGLDVNIRGLQGQGRVAMTVDGALNGTSVYRGYQGVSNRSFVDPDFISNISIEKGPSMGSAIPGGIGGTVSMTTLNVNDIVAEGETSGLRFKFSAFGNTSEPGSHMNRSILAPKYSNGDTYAATRTTERPSFLEPTSGSASIIYAKKGAIVDFLAGFAYRHSGNYHVGSNGDGAPQKTGELSDYCAAGVPASNSFNTRLCNTAVQFYDVHGSNPFVSSEEVLNTSNQTSSSLLKAVIHPNSEHALEFSYGGYKSKFGENYPGGVGSPTAVITQNYYYSDTKLDRYTARYRWNPESDAIDLKINSWLTSLEEQATSLSESDQTRRVADSWGIDVTNSSIFSTPIGKFSTDYGLSYLDEEVGPADDWIRNGSTSPGREGARQEYSAFTQMMLEPAKWIRFEGGMRYQKYKLQDKQTGTTYHTQIFDREEDAFGYSLGTTITPIDGLQIFANYKQASRLPSLFEATTGFFMIANPELHKEEAKNWEAGINYYRNNLFTSDDELGLKLTYFDNNIDGYMSRRYISQYFAMQVYNIDKAKFSGIEANANYKFKGFDIDAGITYYDNIEFCRPNQECINSSLASDYATNYIPPELSATLAINKSFLDDRANIGARVSYRGERAVTFETPQSGYMPLIRAIPWDAYTIVDLSGKYKLNKDLTLDFSIDNLTDEYYIEALSLGYIPAPGRTFRLGVTGNIGQNSNIWPTKWFSDKPEEPVNWTGLYVGGTFGYGKGKLKGDVTDSSGNAADLENGSRVSENLNNFIFGARTGYNYQFANNIVIGAEAGIEAGNLSNWSGVLVSDQSYNTVRLRATNELESDTNYKWNRIINLKGKLGYSMGKTMIYGTAGAA